MGPLPIIVLSVCLNGLRWMLWLVAILLIVLVIKQKLQNDPDLRQGAQVIAITAFLMAGYASAWASRKVLEMLKFTKDKSSS